MTQRYILLHAFFGYVWGDTAEFPEFKNTSQTPIDAAILFDRHNGEDRFYEYKVIDRRDLDDNEGFLVYEPPPGFQMPPLKPSLQSLIAETITRRCRYVCTLLRIDPEESDDL